MNPNFENITIKSPTLPCMCGDQPIRLETAPNDHASIYSPVL